MPSETITNVTDTHAILAAKWSDIVAAKGNKDPAAIALRRQMIDLRAPLNQSAAHELAVIRHEAEPDKRANNLSIAPSEQHLPAPLQKRRAHRDIVVSHASIKCAPKPKAVVKTATKIKVVVVPKPVIERVEKPKVSHTPSLAGTVDDPFAAEVLELYKASSLKEIEIRLSIGARRITSILRSYGVEIRAVGTLASPRKPKVLDMDELRLMREIGFSGGDCARILHRDRKRLAKVIRDMVGGDPFGVALAKLRVLKGDGLNAGQIGVAVKLRQMEVERRLRLADEIEAKNK